MKKLLALVALLVAAPAHAGIGATAKLGTTNDAASTFLSPTLDYRADGILGQVHVVDLIGELVNKRVDLGVAVSGVALRRKVGQEVEGVIMPGGFLQVDSPTTFKNINWQILAQTRFGAEIKQKMGFGIYVVPMLGASNYSGKASVSYGGGVEISAWLVNDKGGDGKGKGKGKGGGKGRK
jgi:hypothetical protein